MIKMFKLRIILFLLFMVFVCIRIDSAVKRKNNNQSPAGNIPSLKIISSINSIQTGKTPFDNFNNFKKGAVLRSGSASPSNTKSISNSEGDEANSGEIIRAFNESNNSPIFIKGELDNLIIPNSISKTATNPSLEKVNGEARTNLLTSYQFIKSNERMFKISDPLEEFEMKSYTEDNLGNKHIKLKQKYMGIEVWAREVIFHFDGQNRLYTINGRYEPTPDYIKDIKENIFLESAIKIVKNDLSGKTEFVEFSDELKKIFDYNGPSGEKVIWFNEKGIGQPVWLINIRPNIRGNWYYFIDIKNGNILFYFNNTPNDGPATSFAVDLNKQTRTVNSYNIRGTYYMLDASKDMFSSQY